MNSENLKLLFKGYFEETLSEDEQAKVKEILSSDPSLETLRIFDTCYLLYSKPVEFKTSQKNKIWKKIQEVEKPIKRFNPWITVLKYAAILLVFGIGTTYISQLIYKSVWHKQDAIYEKKISLISHQFPQIHVFDKNNQEIVLSLNDLPNYGLEYLADSSLKFNGISNFTDYSLFISTTPGQIQKILAIDGSEIWLNSKSSLSFESSFGQKNREVKLIGEAYFEVAHQPLKPFIVHYNSEKTEVLGTHFNIKSYPQEKSYTTLLEGSVRVSNLKNQMVQLKPGEQSYSNPNLKKRQVHVEDYIAWKNGDFYFDNLSLEQLLDQVEEWYNISFINYEQRSNDRISGTFKRSHSLEELLKNIEEISSVKFKIKEGGIYVLKK